MKSVRVVVLDDSLICRTRLKDILEAEGDISVVGEAANGDGVLELIARTEPRLLMVDLQMPGTGGHETIERVMANRPLPILVVTGQPEGVRRAAVFESIRRGALDLAEKPLRSDRAAEARLRALVRELSTIPVVRHVAGRFGSRERPAPTPATTPGVPGVPTPGPLVIGIGASAGGPLALATLLNELPRDLPAAIAVVQHLPQGFAPAFAEFLQGRVSLPVSIVQGRTPLRPGTIHLAPDGKHLVVADGRALSVTLDAPVEGHRPSIDTLLHSLARALGPRAAGVVMSGIGRDGVSGLAAMRAQHALTLAQDQASCAVYGIPKAALEAKAVEHALDPLGLARALRDWARSASEQRTLP